MDEPNPSPILAEDNESYLNGGQLTFQESTDAVEDDNVSEGSAASMTDKLGPESPRPPENSSKRRGQKVMFEIISAKEITTDKKKYMNYTILIKRVPGLEVHPGLVERRYSEFLALYQTLTRNYPGLLNNYSFPKKIILGNFSTDVIAERSRSFQHFMTCVYTVKELRTSPELKDFLYGHELEKAHRILKQAQFEDAATLLENIYFIEEKILDRDNYETYYTLCMLVACLNAVNNSSDAYKYAELALPFTHKYETSELTLPLLFLCLRLWWNVGKDKRVLEARVHTLTASRGSKQPTLLELVLQKDAPLRPIVTPSHQ